MDSSNPRLFIGIKIELTSQNINQIRKLKHKLADCKISWVPINNYHITLKFLGVTPRYYTNSIKTILEQVAREISSFEIRISGLGYFGKPFPKVIWTGIDADQSLYSAQQIIDSKLEELGFEKEDRAYHPHLTLGRVKKISCLKTFNNIIEEYSLNFSQSVNVSEIILFESKPIQKGVEYIELGKVVL